MRNPGINPKTTHDTIPNSAQLPLHLLPPPWSKSPRGPHRPAARQRNNAHPREQPSIPDSIKKRLRHHNGRGGKDIPHEIIDRDAIRRLFRHEFRQHGRYHTEDQHRTEAEEEIRDERDRPGYAALGCPAVPDESAGVEESCYPGVFAHAVFRSVHQFPLFIIASCSSRFARHDFVGPFPAEDGGGDVTDGVGNVG